MRSLNAIRTLHRFVMLLSGFVGLLANIRASRAGAGKRNRSYIAASGYTKSIAKSKMNSYLKTSEPVPRWSITALSPMTS